MTAMNNVQPSRGSTFDTMSLRRQRVPASRGPHRPTVALILLATIVQLLAMAALLGSMAVVAG